VFEFAGLRFRPLEKADLQLVHGWENDFELMMYSRSKPLNVATMDQLEKQYEERAKEKKNFYFIVENMGSGKPIGLASLRTDVWGNVRGAELGIYIGEKALWGKSFGKKMTVALLEMAFYQLNMERCEAWSVEYNVRAHKVLEFCGLKKGGAMRNTVHVAGKKWGSFHFDILQKEYMEIRMKLLERVLGDEVNAYLKRTRPFLRS
jgi:RimJ/RimL family protein N-acetyltransferase